MARRTGPPGGTTMLKRSTTLINALTAIAILAIAGCNAFVAGGPEAPAASEPPRHGQGSGATPRPLSSDPWSVPFGSREESPPIYLKGCADVVIEDLTFRDLGPNVEAIRIENCSNVTIRANDFINVAQAITAYNSTNVRVEWNRYSNIVGPHARDGRNRANFVQFVNASGGYVGHNKGKGGDTEDIVSIFSSHGTADAPILVEYNHFEGVDWTSQSGSGILIGDGGGSWIVVQHNTLLNPGQIGIGIVGGTNNSVIANTVYGERRPNSNSGIVVFGHSRVADECSGHRVGENRVFFVNAAGVSASRWQDGLCPVSEFPRSLAERAALGPDTNQWNAKLDRLRLGVTL